MTKQELIDQIENLTAEQIAQEISKGTATIEECKEPGNFDASKQRSVKAILKKKDDDTFYSAITILDFQNYLSVYPDGIHIVAARDKIAQIIAAQNEELKRLEQRVELLHKIKEDINEFTPDEIVKKLSDSDLDELCSELGFDSQIIKDYTEPELKFNEIPQNEGDIPADYTDVFFWGIPSSGKTCALSSILSTIKKDFSMEAPDIEKKFGANYRDILSNISSKEFAYLPGRTNLDRTQYMPFLFWRRGEKDKRRKISFFELSGEVFKYFYEVTTNSKVINDSFRSEIENSFKALNLLLKSNNQKIHFFFIDYNQETKHSLDEYHLTQSNYLEAAAIYFRDNNEIFKKKTDSVFVVITKSEKISNGRGNESAKTFLNDNFGTFMDVLQNQCKSYSVDFKVKLFSIGDVYFKKICRINRQYSTDIINDLLSRIKPVSKNKFTNFFNR